jgi:hypothetical protein
VTPRVDARARRRATLRAALAAVTLEPAEPELRLLHRVLDGWAGIGLIAAGMQRQGYDLQLTAYGDGHWRATFWTTGMVHSIAGGSAWERTPWTAVQQAARAALGRAFDS